ncbi:hypothetical protein ACFL6S_25370 [Candidatus Poribacteria bacterium]
MNQSTFDSIIDIFEIARPSIEQGINSMQSHDRQKAKQIWQEMVSMIETREGDIEKFSDKLKEFSQQVHEYRVRSLILSSNIKMNIL